MPVNFPNGRTDGQGHVSLESKNSTKYKQYLDLLLRWIWRVQQSFWFLAYFDVFGNFLLRGYVSWDTVLSVSSFLTFFCHLADSMCFTNHVSNWWNFFCCLFFLFFNTPWPCLPSTILQDRNRLLTALFSKELEQDDNLNKFDLIKTPVFTARSRNRMRNRPGVKRRPTVPMTRYWAVPWMDSPEI